jgi:hypothetical protein
LPITHERGYLIPAIGEQYVECADRLRDSILAWHPNAQITILTKELLAHGDQGGFVNDWQCFAASPYRQTIKLEADMFCASPIDHWWTMFENRDVVISQGCRDYYNQVGTSRHYRKIFDVNDLPDVYNAITYWRVSKTAQEFFQLCRMVFEHWDQYRTLLKFPDDHPTTDVVYALVAQIMGPETVTLPPGLGPQIVHMKQHIIKTNTTNWTQELTWEHTNPGLRINTAAQWGLVHYYVKDWQ